MGSAFVAYWYLWVFLLLVSGWVLVRLCRFRTDIPWAELDPNLPWETALDESLSKLHK
jgi:hypothetical protein